MVSTAVGCWGDRIRAVAPGGRAILANGWWLVASNCWGAGVRGVAPGGPAASRSFFFGPSSDPAGPDGTSGACGKVTLNLSDQFREVGEILEVRDPYHRQFGQDPALSAKAQSRHGMIEDLHRRQDGLYPQSFSGLTQGWPVRRRGVREHFFRATYGRKQQIAKAAEELFDQRPHFDALLDGSVELGQRAAGSAGPCAAPGS